MWVTIQDLEKVEANDAQDVLSPQASLSRRPVQVMGFRVLTRRSASYLVSSYVLAYAVVSSKGKKTIPAHCMLQVYPTEVYRGHLVYLVDYLDDHSLGHISLASIIRRAKT